MQGSRVPPLPPRVRGLAPLRPPSTVRPPFIPTFNPAPLPPCACLRIPSQYERFKINARLNKLSLAVRERTRKAVTPFFDLTVAGLETNVIMRPTSMSLSLVLGQVGLEDHHTPQTAFPTIMCVHCALPPGPPSIAFDRQPHPCRIS